jgi:hypothetical protein
MQRWSKHHEEHFELKDKNINSTEEEEREYVQTAEPSSYTEIEIAVDKLKNNKAPSYDQIPAELIKTGGEEIKKVFHKLISRIWEEEVIPQEWKYGVINPVHKKEDTRSCENYRAMTLLCTAYKILVYVLYLRLIPYIEITGAYQRGFRGGRSTVDQIFTMRVLLEKCWEQNIETHHLFVDFKSAYDSIWKEEIWTAMHKQGFPKKLVVMCKIISKEAHAIVKAGKETSHTLKKGLRQGDAIAPLLFNVALETAVQHSQIETSETIFYKSCHILGYADDIVISGRRIQDVKNLIIFYRTNK